MLVITSQGQGRKGEVDQKIIQNSYFSLNAVVLQAFYRHRQDTGPGAPQNTSQRGNSRSPPIISLCTAHDCSALPKATYPGAVSSFSGSKDHEMGGLPLPVC